MGTTNNNGLQSESPANLSGNLSREPAQVWHALSLIGQQLQNLASAMGEGSFAPGHFSPTVAPPHAPTVNELVNDYLLAKARAGRCDRYLRALKNSLSKFVEGRAQMSAGTVTSAEIEKWIFDRKWKPRTQKGYLADVRTLYNFAVRRGLVNHNPANGVENPTLDPPVVSLHRPVEVARVLEFARAWDLNLCRLIALRYFAGLRSSEANLLRESEIGGTHIEVTAANAKTRRRRLVTIQPALRAWLDLGGSLAFGDKEQRMRKFCAALATAEGIKWPHNVTRHSFVSYHVAQFQNSGKSALEAGHSEQMLFAQYRELVTPSAAKDFWEIVPGDRLSVTEPGPVTPARSLRYATPSPALRTENPLQSPRPFHQDACNRILAACRTYPPKDY